MNIDRKQSGKIARGLDFLLVAFVSFLTVLTLFILFAFTEAKEVDIQMYPPDMAIPDSSAFKLNGGSAELSNKIIITSGRDESAIIVSNSAALTISNSAIITSGNTSNADKSSFVGLNAGVLASSKGIINISNCSIKTSGTGANGVFAYGSGSSVTVTNDSITCTGRLGHGVDATFGGKINVTGSVIITGPGGNSAAIATDRGGGTVTVDKTTVLTSGKDAPGIYSTGTITVSNSEISSTTSEAAVIEGSNSITLDNTNISANSEGMIDKWGVLIYQSFSGDAEGQNGKFSMTGGKLNYNASSGPLFFVTNTHADIYLKGVSIGDITSGVLLRATGYRRWPSRNGITAKLTADSQKLTGSVVADSIASVIIDLKNGSLLTGTINYSNKCKKISVALDNTCKWVVTGNSFITTLANVPGVSGDAIINITGNGYNVYYKAGDDANSYLGGKTYSLVNGGKLIPY